jgi:hypothetical protein
MSKRETIRRIIARQDAERCGFRLRAATESEAGT